MPSCREGFLLPWGAYRGVLHQWFPSEDFGPKVYSCLYCCRLISAEAFEAKVEEFKELIRKYGATHYYFLNDEGKVVYIPKVSVVMETSVKGKGKGGGKGGGGGGGKGAKSKKR
jgi:hypothetical protein